MKTWAGYFSDFRLDLLNFLEVKIYYLKQKRVLTF